MDIFDLPKSIKFSSSSYLENIFQSRIQNKLSKENLEKIINQSRKKAEEDLDSNENDLNNKTQAIINEKINEIIGKTGKEIYDNFLNTHKENSLTIYKEIDFEDFFNSFAIDVKILISKQYMFDIKVLQAYEKFIISAKNLFNLKIDELLKDEKEYLELNNLKYMKKIEVLLLANEEKLIVKTMHNTTTLSDILSKAILENEKSLIFFIDFLKSCNIIKDIGSNTLFNTKTAKTFLNIMFFNNIRYSEISLDAFLGRLYSGPGKIYFNDKMISQFDLHDAMINRSFNPIDINNIIYNKLSIKI